jgi:hypothetical protein
MIAPFLLQIVQLQRRMFSWPLIRSTSNSTALQWHVPFTVCMKLSFGPNGVVEKHTPILQNFTDPRKGFGDGALSISGYEPAVSADSAGGATGSRDIRRCGKSAGRYPRSLGVRRPPPQRPPYPPHANIRLNASRSTSVREGDKRSDRPEESLANKWAPSHRRIDPPPMGDTGTRERPSGAVPPRVRGSDNVPTRPMTEMQSDNAHRTASQ